MRFSHESENYPWLRIDKHESGIYYYITNPMEALNFGYFKLEDTEEVYKVTGVKQNVQPMCLDFKRNTDEILLPDDIPLAKKVPRRVTGRTRI